jgi:hypothetical protein
VIATPVAARSYAAQRGAVDALYIAEAQDRVWLVARGETLDAERLWHKDPDERKNLHCLAARH